MRLLRMEESQLRPRFGGEGLQSLRLSVFSLKLFIFSLSSSAMIGDAVLGAGFRAI
jgi:hypothetical protein